MKLPYQLGARTMSLVGSLMQIRAQQAVRKNQPRSYSEACGCGGVRLLRELQLAPAAYEFQMLLGVDEQLRDIIRAAVQSLVG